MGKPLLTVDDSYYEELQVILNDVNNDEKFYQNIVDAPFHNKFYSTLLGLGFLAYLKENEQSGTLDRISISDTYSAQGAIKMTDKAFHDMKVPLSHKTNIVITAIETGRFQQTSDWHLLTDPAVTAEDSRFNQAAAGISSSVVYPLPSTTPKGAIIFQYYLNMPEVVEMHHNFMLRYCNMVSSAINKR